MSLVIAVFARPYEGRSRVPSGDRSRVWFPEVITSLRESWRGGMSFPELIQLRDQLQAQTERIVSSRGIVPARVWCAQCGGAVPGAPPCISIRALLFSLSRFGIAPDADVKALMKEWAKYREVNGLDLNGSALPASQKTSESVASGHSH